MELLFGIGIFAICFFIYCIYLKIREIRENKRLVQEYRDRISELLRKIENLNRERKTVEQLLEEKDIMQIFKILHDDDNPLTKKQKLAELWDILPYYPPDWELRKYIVKMRDSYKCQGCGKDLSERDAYGNIIEAHVYHIVPLSCKGTNEIRNLILLCSECHKELHSELYAFIKAKITTERNFKKNFTWPEYQIIIDQHKRGIIPNFRKYKKSPYETEDEELSDSYDMKPNTDKYYNIPLYEDFSDIFGSDGKPF